jgi:hypothetical protein
VKAIATHTAIPWATSQQRRSLVGLVRGTDASLSEATDTPAESNRDIGCGLGGLAGCKMVSPKVDGIAC